ncbi:hypothetical protein HDR62_01535 [bacterium]|nr:hypothetical protein [bacterium]
MTLEKFFYDNKNGFDTLVWLHKIFNKFFKEQNEAVATYNSLIRLYMDFKKGFQEEQAEKLKKYLSLIRTQTGTNKWDIYRNCVLCIYCKGNETGHRIGIECVFEEETYEYPLGKLHIYIASWAEPHFDSYEGELRAAYPESHIYSKFKNRLFLPIAAITPEGNKDVIISILEKTYNTLKGIIDKHK